MSKSFHRKGLDAVHQLAGVMAALAILAAAVAFIALPVLLHMLIGWHGAWVGLIGWFVGAYLLGGILE